MKILSQCLLIAVAGCFAGTAFADDSSGEGTALSRPNAVSVELLGRGIAYTLDYDRSLGDSVALGIGFEYISGSSTSGSGFSATTTSVSAIFLPIYANFYFAPGPSRFYLTAGIEIVSGTVSDTTLGGFSGSGIAVPLGLGYEYRSEGGFLFRGAGYVVVETGLIQPWFGLSLGLTW